MVGPDIQGSSGGISRFRTSEFKNARSMNFSCPRMSGKQARMRRKTAVGIQK